MNRIRARRCAAVRVYSCKQRYSKYPDFYLYLLIYDRKPIQESPGNARVTRESAIIPRWPPATILDFIEPQIAPFDPPTPKTIT